MAGCRPGTETRIGGGRLSPNYTILRVHGVGGSQQEGWRDDLDYFLPTTLWAQNSSHHVRQNRTIDNI